MLKSVCIISGQVFHVSEQSSVVIILLVKIFRKHKFHQLPMRELHVSLSRTVALQYHWIEAIVSMLGQAFVKMKCFPMGFSELAYYSNDEKTRCVR